MAFVLPNGTVVDPERDDRDRILSAISERRRLAAQGRSQERQAQMQNNLLAQEMQADRAAREQEASLAREEMSQRERMAGTAEASLDTRLQKQFERDQQALRDQNLAMTDEEESLASGIAKRVNDQLGKLGMPPDPVKNPNGHAEWRANWQRIRSQIPTNLENGLIEDGGVWKVNSDYFKLKRARWGTPKKADIAAALSASTPVGQTDESIIRPMVRNASLVNAAPDIQIRNPGMRLPPGLDGSMPGQSIAEALARTSQQIPTTANSGVPPGMPASWFGPSAIQQSNPMGSLRTQIMDALARMFLSAGGAGLGPMISPSYQSGLPVDASPSMQEIGDGLRLRGVTTWP